MKTGCEKSSMGSKEISDALTPRPLTRLSSAANRQQSGRAWSPHLLHRLLTVTKHLEPAARKGPGATVTQTLRFDARILDVGVCVWSCWIVGARLFAQLGARVMTTAAPPPDRAGLAWWRAKYLLLRMTRDLFWPAIAVRLAHAMNLELKPLDVAVRPAKA